MGSGNGFYSEAEFSLDPKWLIDPKLLFVGPKIGEGAHAKVYEGKYKNQNVAIKIVHKGETPDEIAKREARFGREVAMLSRVQHKNLVKFIGACKEPVVVIITELLLGGTLRKYLLNLRPRCLDMRVGIGFALDISRAMECLHSHGIIHRDLKPVAAAVISGNRNFEGRVLPLPRAKYLTSPLLFVAYALVVTLCLKDHIWNIFSFVLTMMIGTFRIFIIFYGITALNPT